MERDTVTENSNSKDAGHVYLLLLDEYRISRNARASWYFSHLKKSITTHPEASDLHELQVLSIVPAVSQSMPIPPEPVPPDGESSEAEGDTDEKTSSTTPTYMIKPSTIISFLAKKYRFVFVLDLSPSVAAADLHSNDVLIHDMYQGLCVVIKNLLRAFRVPGSHIILKPEIYITVIAHTPLISCRSNQVLIQGCLITRENMESVLASIGQALKDFENEIARNMDDIMESDPEDGSVDSQRITGALFDDIVDPPESLDPSLHLMTPEASFINMLRYGMLALHLLQENSSSGIIVLTDGVVGSPEAGLFESLMAQLRHSSITVSFLQVGQWSHSQSGLGQVPYNELMQFMATATFGAYFTKIRDTPDTGDMDMNVYQVALLTWSFQRALTGLKVDGDQSDSYEELNENLAWTHRIPLSNFAENRHLWATPLAKKKHTERTLATGISHLISCRLREGYTIKKVSFPNDTQIEVHLVLPWRDKVWIHYGVQSAWPLNNSRRHARVEVTIEGSYDFLHDVTCPMNKPSKLQSPFRTALIKKYWQSLQGMLESDKLLVHLQSFSSNPQYYMVPDSVKCGVPLFTLPPQSSSPQINIQLNAKDALVAQFASFWKPVLMLDVNIWQKWMHTHRIGLILSHDKPLGKYLHTPNSSGRFHTVSCRQAQTALNAFLSEVSTFVLMENHAYITLIFKDEDKPPTSFYVTRVVHKAPCLVLRLAFLGGTSGEQRYKLVEELTVGIKMVMFPKRGTSKSDKSKKEFTSPKAVLDGQNQTPIQQLPSAETPCCHIMGKPVEKILMRYERLPQDYFLETHQSDLQSTQAYPMASANQIGTSVFTTLSRYLYHRRWVWSVQQGAAMPMSMHAVGRILSNLSKIRLEEGFLFANANSGIINMIAEVEVQDNNQGGAISPPQTHTCLLQYLIFPPQTTTMAGSTSVEDMDEGDVPEADRELLVITEVWVEPQHGRVVNSPRERQHFDDRTFQQLATATVPRDLECISTMVTFEYLYLMCQDQQVPSPSVERLLQAPKMPPIDPIREPGAPDCGNVKVVERMPFCFDLLKVLSKCQQAELLLSAFIQDVSPDGSQIQPRGSEGGRSVCSQVNHPNILLMNHLLEKLEDAHDREIQLSDEDSAIFQSIVLRRSRDVTAHPVPFKEVKTTRKPLNAHSLNTASNSYSSHGDAENTSPEAEHSEGQSDSRDQVAREGIPQWRCFLRSINSTHLILCFAPATFDDLCALVLPETESGTAGDDEHTLVEHSELEAEGATSGIGQEAIIVEENLSQTEGTESKQTTASEVDRPEFDLTEADTAMFDPSDASADSAVDSAVIEEPKQFEGDENQGDEETESMEASESEAVQNQSIKEAPPIALNIPIYVYNCPLSTLTDQIVNKWTHQALPDVFHDWTMDIDTPATELRHSLTEDSGESHRHRTESEHVREKIRQSIDDRQDHSTGPQLEFQNHLHLMRENYHRSFVKGVYDSLLHGHDMHHHDVDAVINGICEESLPLEMNITRFLHSTCGHIRRLVGRAKIEEQMREDNAKIMPKCVEKEEPDSLDHESSDPNLDASEPIVMPGSPRRALDSFSKVDRIPITLPLAGLNTASRCEAGPSLHALIEKKFSATLGQHFKPVPSNPDFFYYYESDTQSKSSCLDDTGGGAFNTSTTSDSREADHSDVFHSDVDEPVAGEDSECDFESQDSVTDMDGSMSDIGEGFPALDGLPPLFIHLVCSVRTKGRALKSMAIRNLPTCLGDLKSAIGDEAECVDLSELQVTVDVICLMMPSEYDFSESTKRPPNYQRTTSYTSQGSNLSDSFRYDRQETQLSFAGGSLTQEVYDSLRCLSSSQFNAVHALKDEVLWLLHDEIASALLTVPATVETLDMVTTHVRQSVKKSCCSFETVKLQFVYGPERSLTQFIQAFERIELSGYLLNKEANYYYLLLDHARANNLAHAKAVSSALHDLYTDSKSFKPDTVTLDNSQLLPKTATNLKSSSNFSDSAKINKSDSAFPEKSADKLSVIADRSRHSSSESEKKRATFKVDLVDILNEGSDDNIQETTKKTDPPVSILQTTSVSGEGVEKSADVEKSTETGGGKREFEGSEGAERSKFGPIGDDIKISVIRPSPVKEHAPGTGTVDHASEKDSNKEVSSTDSQNQTSTPKSATETRTLHFANLESRTTSSGDVATVSPIQNSEKSIPRRTASSASLEKFKAGLKSEHGATSSGPQTPNRSRHQSGLQTPLSGSMCDTTSQGSGCEDGYDGGSSDSAEEEEEEEEIATSFSESMLRHRQLPDFWLIMMVNQGQVDVYFHTRDIADGIPTNVLEQKQLFEHVISTIKEMCRTVNQRLLLQELYNDRFCNQLLVPEADEDVQWPGLDKSSGTYTKHRQQADSDDSDTEATQDRYLEAALHVRPGYFACDCVWKKEFILHPRLKTKDPHRVCRGMQVLKNILVTFAVTNRKNMFVIQETSTGAVFYLRVDECHTPQRQNSGQSGTTETSTKEEEALLSVSRSSSMISLPHRGARPSETDDDSHPRPMRSSMSEFPGQRSMTESMLTDEDGPTSSSVRSYQLDMGDSIVLSAYGIGNVGPDISQELVCVLQRRLDDAVLEILVGLYARNPMFKLMPEDVQFIQPKCSSPKQILRLTIPPSALLNQHALSYYLCQNMLQFLHTPRYADPSADKVFRDYLQPKAPPIEDNHVFLCCTRPQHAGGKGVACVQQTFVDGKGNKIQLMNAPKPSCIAYKDSIDPSMFESLVSTHVYNIDPTSKLPGPTALVEFAIWTHGEVDSQLPDRLVLALKHAVCDVMMEYRLLTAPLCDVPSHYSSGVDSPMHSAPQSPVAHYFSGYEQGSYSASPGHGELVKMSTDGGRTPKEKTVFNLPSLFKSKSASRDSPKESPVSSHHFPMTDHKRKESEIKQKIHRYEHGERGILQEMFSVTMVHWLDFNLELGVPATQRFQCELASRHPIEYVLREFNSVMGTLASDMVLRIFKLADPQCTSHDGRTHTYLPYTVSKSGTHSQEKSDRCDSWADLPTCVHVRLPGKASEYILIARNMAQWRSSIDIPNTEDDATTDAHNIQRSHKSTQRFLPMEAGARLTSDKSDSGVVNPENLTEKAFVPRQKLMFTTIRDKKIKVYTYNWVPDNQNSLEMQVTKMVDWHNGRSQLLTSIISHKAGLIQTTRACSGDLKSTDGNMFMLGSDLQPLVKYTNPPHTLQQQQSSRARHLSISKTRSAQHNLAILHNIYRDKQPTIPMHKSQYANMRDPIHRHGAQMLDLKRTHKKEEEKNGVLRHLYENWQQRMGPSHTPINESDLELLKTSSRLIHNVATPLLLSSHWRQTVLGKSRSSRHNSRASDTPNASRSRHSSGASIRSKRSDSVDSKKRVDSPEITKSMNEEVWHINLRSSFVSQYIQYLQSLGFVQIRTRSVSPKRSSRHFSGDLPTRQQHDSSPQTIKPNYAYLQKTLPGGIMLLELGFKEVYFCVHVYAFECSRLPIRSINPQLAVIFTDECEKFKDLTHAHSFAHDFHLRTIQSYIMGCLHVIKTNYHLSGFLQDFVRLYPYAPTFSRNYILAGVCNLTLKNNSDSCQLFRYMLDHDKLYGMRAIKMVPPVEDDMETENEYALVKQFSGLPEDDAIQLKAKPNDYDVGLVITHDFSYRAFDSDRPTLRLKYYVLLTSRNDLFPRHTLERRLGIFKSNSAKQFPGSIGQIEMPIGDVKLAVEPGEMVEMTNQTEPLVVPPVVQYISVERETTNYLGYSNKHQTIIYNTLLRQAEYAREKINEMVGSAMSQCRRDLLWQRMLLPGNVTEEEGRRKRRSEHDEGRDPFLTRLSFTEFQELLDIVTRINIRDIDAYISTLENMSMSWYHGLVRVLRNQYGSQHRFFASSDGLVQYVVVLNPNYLDTFMMLGVDSLGNKAELSAVYRCRLPETSHTPMNPNLPANAVQTLMEGFVNTCFYYMWTGLL